jgi:hypothetical protein
MLPIIRADSGHVFNGIFWSLRQVSPVKDPILTELLLLLFLFPCYPWLNLKKGCGNMDETRREQIANERFALIAPIVKLPKETVNPGQRYAILRDIARVSGCNL